MAAPDQFPVEVKNSEFLRELAKAAPKGAMLWTTSFAGTPDLTDARNWGGRAYNPALMSAAIDDIGDENTYFSVAALLPTPDSLLRRRKQNFCRLLALVVDDVQLDEVHGQVSYILETSPGKTQVGILIDGACRDAAILALVDRLVTTMAERGLHKADTSGNNAVRYVRLPVGQNQKPRESGAYPHRLLRWAPNVRMSLEDAAAAFGIDLDHLRSEVRPEVGDNAGAGIGRQGEMLRLLTANVVRGERLHESINEISASLVATGVPGGAAVNILRGLMESGMTAKDDRWLARYNDIARSVSTAQEKFGKVFPLALPSPTSDVEHSGLPLVFAENITADAVNLSQLVEDVLTVGGLSVMYGESNSGKSFLACDMDCSIASGTEWLGKRTVRTAVLYVAGEGSESIKLRVLAWRQHHGVDPWLAVVPVAVNLLNPLADAAKVIAATKAVEAHYKCQVGKITIDTLARAFGGGNENASEDMGAVISTADMIRSETGAHVMFVHHAGKDASKGSRGHSSLKAATDTEIEVTGDAETKLHCAKITKQRDLSSRGDELTSRFIVVPMGVDQWGKPITTCVVESTTDRLPVADKSRGQALQQALMDTLGDAPARTMKRTELVKILTGMGFTTSPVYRTMDQLARQNVLTEVGGRVHLNGNSANPI